MVVGLVGCGNWGRHILRDLVSLGCEVPVVVRSQESKARAREGGAGREAASSAAGSKRRKPVRRLKLVLLTVAALTLFGASPAAAATLRVDDDRAQCPDAAFTTVQSAVTAAGSGDRVQVCPATYREQVRIDGPGKNGLRLEALRPLQAVIQVAEKQGHG